MNLGFDISKITLASIQNKFDEVRAQVYPKNETERKVYEALSSKNWGASTTLLHEIAGETFDYEKYGQIMKLIWAAIDNPGRTWKLLFKAITLIQFLIKNGNERVVEECRDHLHSLRPLQDYNFYEGTVDKGSGVRDLSKQVVELLSSNELIRTEREKARQLRNKFIGVGHDGNRGGGGSSDPYGGRDDSYARRGIDSDQNRNSGRRDSYKDGGDRGGGDSSKGKDPDYEFSRRVSSAGSRGGGGAYDSEKPNRFDDNETEEDLDYASKMKARAKSNTSTSNSKIKVSIKGSTSTLTKVSKGKAPVEDLLGGSEPDLFGSSELPSSNFDAFGGFSAAPTQSQATFDAFSGGGGGHMQNNQFAAFGGGFDQPVANPVAHPVAQQSFDFFQQPAQQQQSQDLFQQGAAQQAPLQPAQFMQQPQQSSTFQGFPPSQPLNMQQAAVPSSTMNSFQPQVTPAVQQPALNTVFTTRSSDSNDSDFGGFESAPNQQQPSKPVPENKFASFAGLVDLGNLTSKTEEMKKQAAQPVQAYTATSSFAGLDGFSKQPQMNMGQPMMQRPPMNSGGMPMQGMGGMMPMQGGPQYGQPMGQPQYGQPQGGMMGGMPMGGYGGQQMPPQQMPPQPMMMQQGMQQGNPQYPQYGQPMGQPQYGQPQYGQPQYGQPQYGQAPPRPGGW